MTKDGELPELLTMQQASVKLGVSPSTLRRWEKAGKIRVAWTAGGWRRFPRSEVSRILNRQPQKKQSIGESPKEQSFTVEF